MGGRVILDVDTGVDDALAILFALRSPAIDLRAITCVAGNVGVDQVVRNTLTVLANAGSPAVPVARGAAAPLSIGRPAAQPAQPLPPAQSTPSAPPARSVHGRDGLADLGLPPPGGAAVALSAVDLLRREILTATEPLTVVACGPLTNLAHLTLAAPALVRRLRRLIVVGGDAAGGIGGPGDFNLAYDRRAADAVLGSGVAVTMYSLDVFRRVTLTAGDAEDLAVAGDAGIRLAGLLARHQARRAGAHGAGLGDAGAVLSLVEPDALQTRPNPRWPGVRVAVDADEAALRSLFLATLRAPSRDEAAAPDG
jgi:pyrimidine-specific ribonucleoside hydrolase